MGQPVMQWQMIARNPEAQCDFYSGLFGWKINADNALGYRTVDTGAARGINGGIWPAPPEGKALVSLYVEVDDVAAFVERAAAMGAGVIVPPQKLPDGDEMAVILDPEGIPVGLFTAAAGR
ncbi:MAG TPA: VOC family protein [Candidatus Kapabacteria bacterium]|nr:VOC family protein [Candidatus Kapabacteria bacterium]